MKFLKALGFAIVSLIGLYVIAVGLTFVVNIISPEYRSTAWFSLFSIVILTMAFYTGMDD